MSEGSSNSCKILQHLLNQLELTASILLLAPPDGAMRLFIR